MSATNRRTLSLVHAERGPASVAGARLGVSFELSGRKLAARFDVSGVPICGNGELPVGSSQWGLWDFDVVELFVSTRAERVPYYEFQVSPLGQHFELEVFEPRVRFDREFVSGFRHQAAVHGPDAWSAELEIPLDRLKWDGDPKSLVGNAYAITGAKGARAYWALGLPATDRPDFHRPELFITLP